MHGIKYSVDLLIIKNFKGGILSEQCFKKK